ncbi:response regulator transcription factor [Paenibacillus sp. F411]|uniref:Two component transcriptional regulator, AraC family n=1 Tax=Paenibacillus algicola TaxID=2565926 RepID=A0A4P8XI85_9BACL|nr:MULTISPECIES: response regulator transcription factor [Paenibacillus]MBO2944910.1 response regulator transcription factor [Paenibacillus sp. F411]QCT02302.1 two component transcriptional regulator, AraC family [Paenibacillus algicola]
MYKVFIVDDEPFIIEGLYDAVDWQGFNLEIVGHAGNGRQALEKLKEVPADLLITDISMPVMTGLQLIAEARAVHPNLKVIILSGFDDFDYLKEAMRLGIENYLLKPINLEELEETLSATISKLNAVKASYLLDEYDMSVLKSNILYRWLTGKIREEELAERAALLGLSLDEPYVLVSVLRGQSVRLERVLRELAEQQEQVLYFVDDDGDFVVIFTMQDPELEKPRAIRQLRQIRERCYDEVISISLGSVEDLGEGRTDSYLHAKEAQEYFLVLQQPSYVDYVDIQQRKEETAKAFQLHWPDYAKAIAARNKEELFRQIDHDFASLRNTPGIVPGILHSAAVELIVRFKMELSDIQYSAAPDFLKRTLNGIVAAGAIDELISVIKAAVSDLVDALNSDVKSPVIQQILQHIHEAYHEDLSLKLLGAQYHIHPVYLGHLFHKETGETFAEYINRYRIEKAKELLRTTPLKVQDISKQVGYWETGYFYKQFKKFAGMSPGDFRGLL